MTHTMPPSKFSLQDLESSSEDNTERLWDAEGIEDTKGKNPLNLAVLVYTGTHKHCGCMHS